jgi:hypothetical protein
LHWQAEHVRPWLQLGIKWSLEEEDKGGEIMKVTARENGGLSMLYQDLFREAILVVS